MAIVHVAAFQTPSLSANALRHTEARQFQSLSKRKGVACWNPLSKQDKQVPHNFNSIIGIDTSHRFVIALAITQLFSVKSSMFNGS